MGLGLSRLIRAVIVASLALAGAAQASTFTVATAGTIDSGTDGSGVFGVAGASLAGLGYRLVLSFDQPGSSNSTSTSDTSTSGASPGSVSVTINGVTFASTLVNSDGSILEETPFELYAGNSGDNGTTSNFVTATNALATAGRTFPVSLYQPFSYTALPADAGLNAGMVQFSASDTGVDVSFSATPAIISLAVPEPASAVLLAAGLGMVALRRRGA